MSTSPDVVEQDGEAYLTARGVLKMVEQTHPTAIKPGPSRDWLMDFRRRRPAMSEAEAIREVLRRIGCEHLMPGPREVKR